MPMGEYCSRRSGSQSGSAGTRFWFVRRGLLDTSVLIDHDLIDADRLPDESAIAAVTLAELAAGPHATEDESERARRQDHLQWASATWDPLPFDADAARAYGARLRGGQGLWQETSKPTRRPSDRLDGRGKRARLIHTKPVGPQSARGHHRCHRHLKKPNGKKPSWRMDPLVVAG